MDQELTPTRVWCRSGYTYAQQPYALEWQGTRLEVSEVLHTWRTPQALMFTVRAASGQVFELAYREAEDDWLAAGLDFPAG